MTARQVRKWQETKRMKTIFLRFAVSLYDFGSNNRRPARILGLSECSVCLCTIYCLFVCLRESREWNGIDYTESWKKLWCGRIYITIFVQFTCNDRRLCVYMKRMSLCARIIIYNAFRIITMQTENFLYRPAVGVCVCARPRCHYRWRRV